MKKEYAIKLVAALRSGKYQQTRETLHHKDIGYCCLGVLCDIVDPDGWIGDEHQGLGSMPSSEVNLAATGDDKSAYKVIISLREYTLDRLNDSECLNFNQIAAVIEANFVLGIPITWEEVNKIS